MSIDMQDPIESADFRSLFRGHAGELSSSPSTAVPARPSFTATSLTSVSMEPPMVSFGISRSSSCSPHLRNASSVVVNFLTHDQDSLARTFATRGIDRFASPLRWRRLDTGEPVLSESHRWLRADIRRRIPVGDHDLVVAAIVEIHVDPAGHEQSALVYHDGLYHPVGLG